MSMYDYAGRKVTVNVAEYADWEEDYEDDDYEDEDWEDEDCEEENEGEECDGEEDSEEEPEGNMGCYSKDLCTLRYSDVFGYQEMNAGEEEYWSIGIRLTFAVGRDDCIYNIGYTAQVYGGEGLGDVDAEECWCDEIDEEGEKFFKFLTAPREE